MINILLGVRISYAFEYLVPVRPAKIHLLLQSGDDITVRIFVQSDISCLPKKHQCEEDVNEYQEVSRLKEDPIILDLFEE